MSVPSSSRVSRYLTVILRWLLITFVVFVLTFLAGKYITKNLLSKVYTATAQIQILPNGAAPASGLLDPSQFQAEFEIMESPEFLLPIIYDLGLDKAWAKRVDQSDLDALPSQDALLPEDALAYMHKILKFKLVRGTNIVKIAASSNVPKEAADIANTIADRYKALRDLQQDNARRGSNESPVRIISRAEPPTEPSNPSKSFDFIVTILVAGFLSLVAASFVEIILLFSRASERTDN